jgi:hypothetical protein
MNALQTHNVPTQRRSVARQCVRDVFAQVIMNKMIERQHSVIPSLLTTVNDNPGICPTIIRVPTCSIPDACAMDTQCGGIAQKCCPGTCGGRQCMCKSFCHSFNTRAFIQASFTTTNTGVTTGACTGVVCPSPNVCSIVGTTASCVG